MSPRGWLPPASPYCNNAMYMMYQYIQNKIQLLGTCASAFTAISGAAKKCWQCLDIDTLVKALFSELALLHRSLT